jgi:hypothetical protein
MQNSTAHTSQHNTPRMVFIALEADGDKTSCKILDRNHTDCVNHLVHLSMLLTRIVSIMKHYYHAILESRVQSPRTYVPPWKTWFHRPFPLSSPPSSSLWPWTASSLGLQGASQDCRVMEGRVMEGRVRDERYICVRECV